MRPARTYPKRRDDVRLLVIDPAAPGTGLLETRTPALPDLLSAGDLLVVNDAATLPASLRGRDPGGRAIEVRLIGTVENGPGAGDGAGLGAPDGERFWAVLFGAGDWHDRTEDRPPPPELPIGAGLRLGTLVAEITARSPISPRLVQLRFDRAGDGLWAALYAQGHPVQYSHLAHDLPLWAVQTVYAARPWAFEMPSAGRPLSWEILLALRRKGVRWAALTHAAGLSATGDPALDAALPLPERYEIPAATARAVNETRARGGRVVAVGTTVVRALEGAAAPATHGDGGGSGLLRGGRGVTSLRITPAYRPRFVDGLLSGTHAAHESHFALLAAFAGGPLLAAAAAHAERAGFLTHELGDATLVLPGALAAVAAAESPGGSRISAA